MSERNSNLSRRLFLVAGAGLVAGLAVPALAQDLPSQGNVPLPTQRSGGSQQVAAVAEAPADVAQKIANHFSSVKSMTGEFMQFGPRGDQAGGKFYLERPGKLRFDYDPPSTLKVIADGRNVAVGNGELSTWDFYPLSRTPLSLLLADQIDLQHRMVRGVRQQGDLTVIVLGDSTIFGDQVITLMFDTKSFELRQWTITDAQGKDTTVILSNVQTGVKFGRSVFRIPYDQIMKGPGSDD
ncbi:outer membrane lipoprotein carrier protein LolA [Martelella endophytica]|uniref:Membrane protein n=1 Tax=Martelella endophytica TaxID=1486262 RepID=A0A0D5LXA0_MAREN|nr:outer membrane lipoprotein carrier protein LolA [Martelella endophytica]AJY48417.1 membrane protein [Martelella endophytica]